MGNLNLVSQFREYCHLNFKSFSPLKWNVFILTSFLTSLSKVFLFFLIFIIEGMLLKQLNLFVTILFFLVLIEFLKYYFQIGHCQYIEIKLTFVL